MEIQLQKGVRLKNQEFLKESKGRPYASLHGSTFNANHLDSFLQSEWGHRPDLEANRYENLTPRVATDRGNTRTPVPGQRGTSSMPFVQTNIRPSYAFISIGREFPSQPTYYDLSAKSSTLLKRPELRTLKEKMKTTLFDSERKGAKTHFDTQDLFFKPPEAETLKNPTQRRLELHEMKRRQQEFKTQQTEFKFLNKRDRTIKNGWRSGIVGVEIRGDDKHSTFYGDVARAERRVEKRKQKEHEARAKTLDRYRKTTSDIGFFNREGAEAMAREKGGDLPPKRAIDRDWMVKKKVEIEHRTEISVKQSVFAHSAKQNIHRTDHLHQQDKRGRGFNLLSGGVH